MTEQRVRLRRPRHRHDDDGGFKQVNYEESAPFFSNPRGVLIHRVRSLYRLSCDLQDGPWWIVDYWCENFGRGHDEIDDLLLFDPGEKLICTRCEALAVAKGEPTSSELAGRHVCTGVVRPVNTCCDSSQN